MTYGYAVKYKKMNYFYNFLEICYYNQELTLRDLLRIPAIKLYEILFFTALKYRAQ